MNVKELSELITNDPNVKAKVGPAAIRAVYSAIRAELEKDGVEKLALQGLGNFIVKKVEKDGVVKKRILFRPAKAPKTSN